MKVFGFTADQLRFDLKYGDWGWFGGADGIRRTTGDPAREPFDMALIAAAGPSLEGVSLDAPSAATDRRCVDLWAMPNWPLLAWRMNATWQARRLARTEPFRVAWTYAVIALDALGDEFVSLEGDEVDRFLADLPNAVSPDMSQPPQALRTCTSGQRFGLRQGGSGMVPNPPQSTRVQATVT